MKRYRMVPWDAVPYTPLEIGIIVALSAANGLLLGLILGSMLR